jgi:pimeloyl-ACP methyl ester carboxylesterase
LADFTLVVERLSLTHPAHADRTELDRHHVRIALLGCGTVGSGVALLLLDSSGSIAARSGVTYSLDACEALEAVRAYGRAPLVAGHSMGGLLALALAAERPADVSGLFLIEPVYAPEGGRHLGGALAGVARVVLAPLVGSVGRDGRVGRALSRWVFEMSFEDRDAMERAWLRQRTQVPVEYPKMMYEAFEGPSDFPNRAFALELTQPVTLLEGSVARRTPRFPELNAVLRERLGPRFTYLQLEGGHYLQLDRPAAVNDALRDALCPAK